MRGMLRLTVLLAAIIVGGAPTVVADVELGVDQDWDGKCDPEPAPVFVQMNSVTVRLCQHVPVELVPDLPDVG